MSRLFLFLVNPRAGRGGTARLRSVIARLTPTAPVNVVLVRSADEMNAALHRLRPGVIPVAAGGDGTANLLARTLWKKQIDDVACGVLPLGTGNAWAHSLGMGRLRDAIAALCRGEVRSVDVMRTSDRETPIALVSISTGFESRFLGALGRQRTWGRAFGAARGLAAVLERPSVGVELSLDERPFVFPEEKRYNVGLYNVPCYGFGFTVVPQADPEDGHAEAVTHATAASYWRALRRGGRLTAPASPDAKHARWERAHLRTRGAIQVDGETIGAQSLDVSVEHRALQWIVPPRGPSAA